MSQACSTAPADRSARPGIANIGNATMSVTSPDQPSIEDLAEEFLDRRRRGERPSLEEYVTRYPDLAVEIREFFPVLGLVEDFKPGTGDVSGSIAGSNDFRARANAGATGRLSLVAGSRPGRDGGRVRGRARIAGPSRGLEGAAQPSAARPQES